jgi:hypothetical protein
MLAVTRIPVGVVVERSKSTSPWTDVACPPIALLVSLKKISRFARAGATTTSIAPVSTEHHAGKDSALRE